MPAPVIMEPKKSQMPTARVTTTLTEKFNISIESQPSPEPTREVVYLCKNCSAGFIPPYLSKPVAIAIQAELDESRAPVY